MKLSINADIELDQPGQASYVTWFDVRPAIRRTPQPDSEHDRQR